MATITRTASGKWRVQVKYQSIRETTTVSTKREAELWAAERLLELKAAGDSQLTVVTFDELSRRYEREVTAAKRGKRWEGIRLAKFRNTLPFSAWPVADIRHWHVQEWVDSQRDLLAPGSINRELNLLSNIFTWAMRWRYIVSSPTRLVARPKGVVPRDRRITQNEVDAILVALHFSSSSATDSRYQVAVAFLLAIETAMRAGEIVGIRPEHVFFDKCTVVLPMTKNGRSRVVPLSPQAIALLRLLPDGFSITSSTLSTLFARAVKRAGVENLTFHDSRHEAITRLARIFSPLELARIVGHTDLKQLMVYYNESAESLALRFTSLGC